MRTIKILVEVPCYPNIKDDVRLHEEDRLIQLIDKHKKGEMIIDLGCGTSYYSGSQATGIDLDKVLLKKADLQFKVSASYTHIPFKDESFDAVVMCHSLEHTNMPWIPLKEAWRILKPNGIIGVSVPNVKGLHAIWLLLSRGLTKAYGCLAPDHLTAFTPQTLKKVLKESGFQIIDEGGDIVYFPLMKRLKLMRLGFWLAKHFPKWANVYILVGEKT